MILAALEKEGVESYHVDFLRNEYRYYARNGESFVTNVNLAHDGVAHEFSADKLENISKRVQAGQAWYPDFVREGAAAHARITSCTYTAEKFATSAETGTNISSFSLVRGKLSTEARVH